MEQFKEASAMQLGRLLLIINYYESHAGGPSLDFFHDWVNDEHTQHHNNSTEHTIRYWEELMVNGEGHS